MNEVLFRLASVSAAIAACQTEIPNRADDCRPLPDPNTALSDTGSSMSSALTLIDSDDCRSEES